MTCKKMTNPVKKIRQLTVLLSERDHSRVNNISCNYY